MIRSNIALHNNTIRAPSMRYHQRLLARMAFSYTVWNFTSRPVGETIQPQLSTNKQSSHRFDGRQNAIYETLIQLRCMQV